MEEFSCGRLSDSLEVASEEFLEAFCLGYFQESLDGFYIDSVWMGRSLGRRFRNLGCSPDELVESSSGIYECDVGVRNDDRGLLHVFEYLGHGAAVVRFGPEFYDRSAPVCRVRALSVLDDHGLVLLDIDPDLIFDNPFSRIVAGCDCCFAVSGYLSI